jgi:GNAT superfamily N-acetyltransferase|tara:strand:- start:72 stop:407 length:336 start_codon:yes stop_codon:yes gene_type:complete
MKSYLDILNESKTKIEYKVEHLDSYGGQNNYELGMYINGDIVGMVEYVIFEKELTVSDVVVVPKYRRKGFGSRMMQYLKDFHKDATYKPSMQTDLGAKFKHKKIKDLYSLD